MVPAGNDYPGGNDQRRGRSRGSGAMANVAVVGTGYVGSVSAVCLAWLGHEVVGYDTNPARAEQLRAGQLPIYEPGLQDKLDEALATGRLTFTADAEAAARDADVIFLCVGTPTGH